MKIAFGSDLHLESWGNNSLPEFPDEADILVIAGDLTSEGDGPAQLAKKYGSIGKPIFYVPGNHEYYHSVYQTRLVDIQRGCDKHNIKFLGPDEPHEHDGVKIVGATLWTDYRISGNEEMSMLFALHGMSDHYVIGWREESNRFFLPRDARRLHEEHLEWLLKSCREDYNPRTVVITHHLPTSASIAPRWIGSRLNPAFASDVMHLFEDCQPAVWIHGHSHDESETTVGNTRVYNHPLGYRGENHAKPGSWSYKIIEV